MKALHLLFVLTGAIAAASCATPTSQPAAESEISIASDPSSRHRYIGSVTIVKRGSNTDAPTWVINERDGDCGDTGECLGAKEVTIDADLKAGKLEISAPSAAIKRLAACVVDGERVELWGAKGERLLAFSGTSATGAKLRPVAPGVCRMAISEQGMPKKKKGK